MFTFVPPATDAPASSSASASACPATRQPRQGCLDPVTLRKPGDKLSFQFLSCLSPMVTDISINNGTMSDVIYFTGEGFGSDVSLFSLFLI